MELPYHKSKDKNLYSNYMNNYVDSNENKLYIQNRKEPNTNKVKKNSISINNNNYKLSFNSNKNNKNLDYLVYQSVLGNINNNLSASNSSKNNEIIIYDTYSGKKDKNIINIDTKNNNIYFSSSNPNKKGLSQSINKYDNNFPNGNSHFKYPILNNKIINKNLLKKNGQFYSSSDSFFKNYFFESRTTSLNKSNNDYQMTNMKNGKSKIENDINKNDNILMDKSEFFKNIKEIQDLDSIEIDSSQDMLDINNSNNNQDKKVKNNNRNSLKLDNYNQTVNNISLKNKNINKLNSEKKDDKNLNYNRINLKHRVTNNNYLLNQKLATDKKQNIKFSKKISEKLFSNLTDNKRKNYLNNFDINDTFSNSNIKRENLKKIYNYEKDENIFDISENYNTFNDILKNNKGINGQNIILENKFAKKLNISPYNRRRYSTITNNNEDNNEIEEINLKDNEEILKEENYEEIYKELIKTKNDNKNLKIQVQNLTKIIKQSQQIIKKFSVENEKKIKKLMNDNKIIIGINNNLKKQIENMKKQLGKSGNEYININVKNDILNKDSFYIKEIKDLKEKIKKYEIENNQLKILLIKNKDREYSNIISRKNFKNSFTNYSENNRDSIYNLREYNKSLSFSKLKNKINIDKSIPKKYKEDKDFKSIE